MSTTHSHEVLVHYLTQNRVFGDDSEAIDALNDFAEEIKDSVIDYLIEEGVLSRFGGKA